MSLMQPLLGHIWESSSQVSPGQDNSGVPFLGHSGMERRALLRWPVGRQAARLVSARRPTDRLPPQGGCATFLCQPLDVLKTRLMNSKGEYQVKTGLWAPGLGGLSAVCRHVWEPPRSQPCVFSYPGDGYASHWGMGAQRQGLCPCSFHLLNSG